MRARRVRRRGVSRSAAARRRRAISTRSGSLDAARRAGAQAIHPGYGFLAENARVRARVRRGAGLVWIGPPPEAIEAMGSKIEARERMRAAGVPIIPGHDRAVESAEEVRRPRRRARLADRDQGVGAAAAARASRSCATPSEVERAFESARREGEAYFSDSAVYVERYLEDPRHVEVQVLADAHGNVIHLGERDCTIQRRHQKLVEETPSPAVDDALRERIGGIAVDAARAVGYRSAGTIEGLLVPDGEYFFLEMNTRIQVEHTVTEMVTGPRSRPRAGADRGAASRCRCGRRTSRCAGTRSSAGSTPRTSRTASCPRPGRSRATGSRPDRASGSTRACAAGSEISPLYDPMIAKLVVHGVDREHARRRMLRALDEFVIEGVEDADRFPQGAADASVLRRRRDVPRRRRVGADGGACRRARERRPTGGRRRQSPRCATAVRSVEVDGRRFEVRVLEARACRSRSSRGARRERVAQRASRGAGTRRGRVADAGHRAGRRGGRGRRGRGGPGGSASSRR